MKNWLQEQAESRGEAPAVAAGERVMSYAELASYAARGARFFAARGVEPGDSVALCGENRLAWIVAAHAAWWRGAAVVGLHHRGTSGELAAQIEVVAPKVVVGDEAAGGVGWARFEEALTQGGESPAPVAWSEASRLTILFTSGTTGRPRAVPLTVGNHDASARASGARLELTGRERWLCCLPLCHIGGLAIVLRAARGGGCVELMERFDAQKVLELLATRPVEGASFVPTMVVRMLGRCDGEVENSLKVALVGGGAMTAAMLRRARRAGLPVVPTYGMTEAASQIATLGLQAPSEFLGTAGRPLAGIELEIRDDQGYPVAPSAVGEIYLRGPMITAGYLGESSRDSGAWFGTGDFGSIDESGRLVVDHRRGARIVSGGENVDPAEVEVTLVAHPGVEDAAVVGVDDPRWGQVVAAAVVIGADGVGIEDLEAFCRSQLAPFKIPRRWVQVEEIPRTTSEKIKRDEVREIIARAQALADREVVVSP